MTDIVARFQRRMEELARAGASGGTELLLGVMDPNRARELRLCAIPHQFDAEIFRVLMPDVSVEMAQLRCAELATLSIVGTAPEGFSVQDSARRAILGWWLEPTHRDELAMASARLVEFFELQESAAQGDRLETVKRRRMYHLLGVDLDKGFAEFARLLRVARHALLYSECANLLRLVGEYEAVFSDEQALWVIYYRGRLASDLRDWNEANAKFRQVLDAPRASPAMRVASYRRLSYVQSEQREWKDAIALCQSAVDLAESASETHAMLPRVVHDLGAAYRCNQEYERAQELLLRSADLATAQDDLSSLAAAHNSLGMLHLDQRDARLAIPEFEASLDALLRNHETFRTAQVYNNLGAAAADIPDWDASASYYQKSLAIKVQAGDTVGQANALGNLSRTQASQGKLDEAAKSAETAVELFRQLRDEYAAAVAMRNLGRLYRRIGRKELAVARLRTAIELFTAKGHAGEAQAAAADLASMNAKSGLPWWAWTTLVVSALFVILTVILTLRG